MSKIIDTNVIEKPDEMTFVDQYISDGAILVLETLMSLHISRNFQVVKDIIFGYDSEYNQWKSRYGESLAKQDYIVEKFAIQIIISKDQEFLKDEGMAFYVDDIHEKVRIYVDDSIKKILDLLFTLSKDTVEYKYIIDIIINEWIGDNTKEVIMPYRSDMGLEMYGSLHYYMFDVRANSWDKLKRISKMKGLKVGHCFKRAVINFLENRADIVKDVSC